jgi:hypothetical protein
MFSLSLASGQNSAQKKRGVGFLSGWRQLAALQCKQNSALKDNKRLKITGVKSYGKDIER